MPHQQRTLVFSALLVSLALGLTLIISFAFFPSMGAMNGSMKSPAMMNGQSGHGSMMPGDSVNSAMMSFAGMFWMMGGWVLGALALTLIILLGFALWGTRPANS